MRGERELLNRLNLSGKHGEASAGTQGTPVSHSSCCWALLEGGQVYHLPFIYQPCQSITVEAKNCYLPGTYCGLSTHNYII